MNVSRFVARVWVWGRYDGVMVEEWAIRPGPCAAALVGLWHDVYRQQHVPLLPAGVRVPFCPRGDAYGVFVDDALVGFCCVDDDWLSELWVAVAWQRKGIGRALLAHAEARIAAKGHRWTQLTVLAVNAPAIAFYERHGWLREPGQLCSVTNQPFYRFCKRLAP